LSTERSKSSGVSPRIIAALAAVIFFTVAAYPQVVPYIKDIVGEDNVENSVGNGGTDNGGLRLLGTFKLLNPDTVPFYIWITFENGGKFKHRKQADVPTIRLVDLELHYKNALNQPVVKKFPNNRSEPRTLKRFSGSWLGGGRSSVKKRTRGRAVMAAVEDEESDVEAETNRSNRNHGASEIHFWKEDAQAYYEMELWGALYSPDVKTAVVAGRYVENIKFDIEPAR